MNKKSSSPLLSYIHRSNRLLFFLLMVVFACLPGGLTNASFYAETSSAGNSFSTTCWVAPTLPTLVSLPNDSLIHQGNAWLSNALLTWNASTLSCPTGQVEYQVVIATDDQFSNIVETSAWLSATQFLTTQTTTGEYHWKVLARDGAHLDITPVSSTVFHYTIDLTNLETPINDGWNLPTQSATPNERPLDLACGAVTDGGNPASPLISHNWQPVSGTNIKYQREITFPDGSTIGFFYETNNYTPFSSFGSTSGIEGLWKSRVKAFEDDNNDGLISSGERTSEFSNYCNVTLDLTPAPASPIVINEILPDPMGPDNAALPFGEWVELYNRSDTPVDVNGWVLYADGANAFPLVISSSNTFLSVPIGPGTTTIPALGRVVVYRAGDANFDIDANGDTVTLYNGLASGSGIFIDGHTFTATRENKSITRSPDGGDTWIDPIPSPGNPNVTDASQLSPSVIIGQQDAHHSIIALLEAGNYQSADIVVEYSRVQDGETVSEAFTKQISITDNIQYLTDLFMGSISSGTENPHKKISDVVVHITLHANGQSDKTIDATMNGAWK